MYDGVTDPRRGVLSAGGWWPPAAKRHFIDLKEQPSLNRLRNVSILIWKVDSYT